MKDSRRQFLKMAAAAAASRVLSSTSLAQTPGKPFRIDTHHHFTIPKLYALSTAKGVSQPTLKDWTPEKSLEQMEQGSVATSIISISDPACGSPTMPRLGRLRANATSTEQRL